MLTTAAISAAVYFHCLGVAILLLTLCPDMTQFPSVMADVIRFIFKDGVYCYLRYQSLICILMMSNSNNWEFGL